MNIFRSRTRTAAESAEVTTERHDARRRQRGQVLPIFVAMVVVLLGGAALLADAAWWWTMEQKMQRAADAGALAGAIHLPGRQTQAFQAAIDEARKNGFTNGQDGVIVTPRRDGSSPRKLIVDIDAPVDTFFARVFGMTTVDVGVTGAGEYTLPVPMGSPENYYGVFGTLREATYTEETTVPTARTSPGSEYSPSASVSGNWDNPQYAYTNGYTAAQQDGEDQAWGNFRVLNLTANPRGIPNDPSVSITGLEVQLRFASRRNGTSSDDCRIAVAVSRNMGAAGGPSWSTDVQTDRLTGSDETYLVGSSASMADWGGGTWSRADFADANFGVRLTWHDGSSACPSGRWVRVGEVEVIPHYTWTENVTSTVTTTTNDDLQGPGTACASGAIDCYNPDGQVLNERGFWATMNTRGAANVNGDAHQPRYINPTSSVAPLCSEAAADGNACYDPDQFYNYAVEMAPGSTGGYVYVFDPGFCQTDGNKGVGDRWFSGSAPVSSWYDLYEDTQNTPYDYSDDTRIASSNSLFTDMDASDSTMGGGNGQYECRKTDSAYGDGRDYHLSWYLLNPGRPLSGGAAGRVYRLHTTGTDPAGNLLSNANGEQSFALYVKADGGAPRIYGLAAMQMFTPLKNAGGASSSEFYLAQIDAAHAGKTVELKLWDPGDTGPLRAHLQVLVPQETGGWAPSVEMQYSGKTGTTHSTVNTACNSNASTTPVSQILTNEGGGGRGEFNGCWLTVYIPIPPDYTATEEGWWKIRYNMSGTGTSNDVTTWKVAVLGNPVHLIPE